MVQVYRTMCLDEKGYDWRLHYNEQIVSFEKRLANIPRELAQFESTLAHLKQLNQQLLDDLGQITPLKSNIQKLLKSDTPDLQKSPLGKKNSVPKYRQNCLN